MEDAFALTESEAQGETKEEEEGMMGYVENCEERKADGNSDSMTSCQILRQLEAYLFPRPATPGSALDLSVLSPSQRGNVSAPSLPKWVYAITEEPKASRGMGR